MPKWRKDPEPGRCPDGDAYYALSDPAEHDAEQVRRARFTRLGWMK